MKKIIFITAILLAVSLSNEKAYCEGSDLVKRENNRLEVIFTPKMDFNDLVKIKLELAELGITIKYNMLKFSKYDELEGIKFSADFHDGYSGGAGTRYISSSKFGFYRDYNEGVEIPVLFGKMK